MKVIVKASWEIKCGSVPTHGSSRIRKQHLISHSTLPKKKNPETPVSLCAWVAVIGNMMP